MPNNCKIKLRKKNELTLIMLSNSLIMSLPTLLDPNRGFLPKKLGFSWKTHCSSWFLREIIHKILNSPQQVSRTGSPRQPLNSNKNCIHFQHTPSLFDLYSLGLSIYPNAYWPAFLNRIALLVTCVLFKKYSCCYYSLFPTLMMTLYRPLTSLSLRPLLSFCHLPPRYHLSLCPQVRKLTPNP